MSPQNESSKQGDQQAVRPSGAVYSIITRNRTPRVNPGEKIEVEIYLSGYGIPKKNKLYIQLSSPYVLDMEKTVDMTSCIRFVEANGKRGPEAGKNIQQVQHFKPYGLTVILNEGNFSEIPLQPGDKELSKFEIPRIMGEYIWDGEPPLFLSFKTSKNAPSGDYDVSFTFTYGDDQNLLQDYKAVPFHITSWWERHQSWGIFIAFISLVITAFGTIYKIFIP